MIYGYIFAQKVDEGFPGWCSSGGPITIAGSSVIFVQSFSLEEALQFLIDNHKKLRDIMSGAFEGLRELAKTSKTVEQLKNRIDRSYVNGDSAAKVIYEEVSLPELPLEGSECFLRFMYQNEDLHFVDVCSTSTDTPKYQSMWDDKKRGSYQADLQLDECLIFDATVASASDEVDDGSDGDY